MKIVDGAPTVTGVGFSSGGHYGCLYFIPGSKSLNNFVAAAVPSATTIKCETSLPADGPIMKAYNSNKKVQVIVQPQVSLDGGKNYIDIPNDKPDTLPFETGTDEGKPLMYMYV